jgi:hypothetical protein
MATLKCNTHLSCTTDVMLPFSWHQGQDPWSNNAATSRAETQQPTQVHPSPAHRTLSGCIHDENVSSAVTIAVLHKTAIVTADQTFSSLFRSRMSISPSISTMPHDLPEGFAFGAGEIVSGPGDPGRKAGPGLQRPLQGARMQPPKPASARPHPPHAVGIGIATCEGVLDGVLEPHWP